MAEKTFQKLTKLISSYVLYGGLILQVVKFASFVFMQSIYIAFQLSQELY